jgi:muramoyltetrapeptide carboxypeptidase
MDAARLIRPAALRPGDRVAVVTPSGPVDPERLVRGAALLEELGFRVSVPEPTVPWRLFAGRDDERRTQLLAAFADPDVRAVWCARGGYGAARFVPDVDAAWLRRHAKLCIGFSDATVLLQLLVQHAGVAALHGPMVAMDLLAQREAGTLQHLLGILAGDASWRVPVPRTIVAGTAEGPVHGGCLAVLASLAGTPLAPRFAGGIDRMLVQLRQARLLDGVRGILFGTMPDCGPADEVCETIADCLGDLSVPIGFGAPVGHGGVNYAVPLGVAARLRLEGPGAAVVQGGVLEGVEPLVA